MTNLIKRLRMINPSVFTLYKTRSEAADEIERLRAALEYYAKNSMKPKVAREALSIEAADEIERLQKRNALLEDVAAAAESQTRCRTGARRRLYYALDKLREWSDE